MKELFEDKCIRCLADLPKGSHMQGKWYCFDCQKIVSVNTSTNVDSLLLNYAAFEDAKSQDAKADNGKPNLSLVPKQIIYEIEKVRDFGVKKYRDPDNWKKVEIERYHQALLRHTLAVWEDISARDKESGLLHLSHMATNIAFILELMNDEE